MTVLTHSEHLLRKRSNENNWLVRTQCSCWDSKDLASLYPMNRSHHAISCLLVYWDCCNKTPPTSWVRSSRNPSPIVLGLRNQRPRLNGSSASVYFLIGGTFTLDDSFLWVCVCENNFPYIFGIDFPNIQIKMYVCVWVGWVLKEKNICKKSWVLVMYSTLQLAWTLCQHSLIFLLASMNCTFRVLHHPWHPFLEQI